jgi:hypothetical protein
MFPLLEVLPQPNVLFDLWSCHQHALSGVACSAWVQLSSTVNILGILGYTILGSSRINTGFTKALQPSH